MSDTFFRSDIYSKRGYLSLLHDPSSNEWKKLWFVVRRPYLHLYDDSKETEELMAINLSTIRVEQSPEIEQMLGVRSVSSSSLQSVAD